MDLTNVPGNAENIHPSSLVLSYLSPDGEEGYPGNLFITLRFELTEENELSHTYTAITDKATPVNLTHHSYFNLDNGEGNIGNTLLKINVSSILEQDENLSVTGKYDRYQKQWV